ncbi:kinase-like domain-containing protein [Rhizophagus irregularis DAOM 181602=DAOM 197198]|nr:kinase-like domain-containing protein [Rhizophagus irregularis DAOM 181602=DAOM 197198]
MASNSNTTEFIGYYNQHGIRTERNDINACELYKEAADKEEYGMRTVKDKLYEEAASQIQEINDPEYCYQNEIGTEKDKIRAFELYKEAAEKEDIGAIYNLANCYQNGIGTEKNAIKAFELYNKAAEKEVAKENQIDSIYALGKCYFYGIGTEKNEIKAFELYKEAVEKEAAKKGDIVATNHLRPRKNKILNEKKDTAAIYTTNKYKSDEPRYATEECTVV